MYAISFRVFIAKLGNQKVFINGSAISNRAYKSGQTIVVQTDTISTMTSGYAAEVIRSQATQRDAASFEWDILDD